MKNIIKTLTIGLFTLFTTIVFANEDKQVTAEQLQYDSDKQESIVVVDTDPYDKWDDYLDKHGLVPGEQKNKRTGNTFFIASSGEVCNAPPKGGKFIACKTNAYEKAVLSAKTQLAEHLGTWIVSSSELTDTRINEDIPESYIKALIKPVSTAERAHKLTDLALDDQIRRFDPEWDGTNITKEEKVSKVVAQNQRYLKKASSHARQFLQGASTIFTAEGYSDREYTVVVGIVWSFKSAKVAEAIYIPNAPLPKGKKNQFSIKDRLKKLSNDKLAASMGTRIWWDERGWPVVVSFAATDGDGIKSIARKMTALDARTQIGQFVSEIIESDADKNTDLTTQAYKNETEQEEFDNTFFEQKIESRSKLLKLSGVGTVHFRKFKHPVSEKNMVVNVMAWTPDSAKLAKALEKMSRDQETKFNATKGGTALGNSYNQSLPAAGVATPGLEGVSSDPDDF